MSSKAATEPELDTFLSPNLTLFFSEPSFVFSFLVKESLGGTRKHKGT